MDAGAVTAVRGRWRPVAGVPLLDVDRSALAVVDRLLDCALAAPRVAEAWRFLGFAAANFDELLVTHGPSEDRDLTCRLDDVPPPAYRRAVRALYERIGEVQAHLRLRQGPGPVAWHAQSARTHRQALAWLEAAWGDVLEPPVAPAFLPSRRLALHLERTEAAGEGRRWITPLPDGVPRFVPLAPRGGLLPIEAIVAAAIARRGVPLRVEPLRPLRRERTFAWSDLAETPEAGIAELLRLRERGPLFAVEQAMPPSPARLALLRRELARHPGPDEPPVRWFGAGPLLDVAPLAGLLPAPGAVIRSVARRAPPPLPSRPFRELLAEGERLVGFPGHDFADTVGRFVDESTNDPDVTRIDATIYRVDAESQLLRRLMDAARRGVDVRVTVELRARGDERRNLDWMARLRSAGVQVDTGPAHLKVHAKLLLVRRAGGPALAYVGTGNLHAGTARAYQDYGLFSADQLLTGDVAALFEAIRGGPAPSLDLLAAAPWSLRDAMRELLACAVAARLSGARTRMLVKLNGLTDPALIDALHQASARGVTVLLAVRGLCLAPPRPDDRLRIVAPAGHVLQHARALVLEVDGTAEAAWIGSADWRERNLDRRVEVWTPVRDPAHRAFLLARLASDTGRTAGWVLQQDGRSVATVRPFRRTRSA